MSKFEYFDIYNIKLKNILIVPQFLTNNAGEGDGLDFL